LGKSGGQQSLAEARVADSLAVDLRDDELAYPSILNEAAEGTERRFGGFRIVGRGQSLDRRPATLDVDRRDAVNEDDIRSCRALQRAAIVLPASRPRERSAVGIGGVGCGEQVDFSLLR
jgi:hypothetical protein